MERSAPIPAGNPLKTGEEPTTRLLFDVFVVRDRIRPTLTKLKVVAGPDDNGGRV